MQEIISFALVLNSIFSFLLLQLDLKLYSCFYSLDLKLTCLMFKQISSLPQNNFWIIIQQTQTSAPALLVSIVPAMTQSMATCVLVNQATQENIVKVHVSFYALKIISYVYISLGAKPVLVDQPLTICYVSSFSYSIMCVNMIFMNTLIHAVTQNMETHN